MKLRLNNTSCMSHYWKYSSYYSYYVYNIAQGEQKMNKEWLKRECIEIDENFVMIKEEVDFNHPECPLIKIKGCADFEIDTYKYKKIKDKFEDQVKHLIPLIP